MFKLDTFPRNPDHFSVCMLSPARSISVVHN